MSNSFDKLSVLDSFIEEVNSYLPDIETNLGHLAQSPGDMDALEETYRRTHTIGGSASMMDFHGLAHVAHGMEDILGDALEGFIVFDRPALGLLRRSLDRLHRLLEGIRNGIDEESVIVEDDMDYAHYRSQIESSEAQVPQKQMSTTNVKDSYSEAVIPSTPVSPFLVKETFNSSPSLEEVLASFRTPAYQPGEEVSWPEDPTPTGQFESIAVPPVTCPLLDGNQQEMGFATQMKDSVTESSSFPPVKSALDTLASSIGYFSNAIAPVTPVVEIVVTDNVKTSRFDTIPTVQPVLPPIVDGVTDGVTMNARPLDTPLLSSVMPASPFPAKVPAVPDPVSVSKTAAVVEQSLSLSAVQQSSSESLAVVQKQVMAVEEHAAALVALVGQLHDAMSVIEKQRSEFKGFLDGSKDALDRMEIWAGKAMGLNLKNSPEQVRRYLPLSVMWVASSKLKKVLESLQRISNGVETTDTQIESTLEQLQTSVQTYEQKFQDLQARSAQLFEQKNCWGPWEMQRNHEPQTMRERVTFERQGDVSALRAELEMQIREEIRQEFDAKQEQRSSIADSNADSVKIKELEARLRPEIEIQVRQDFLTHIMSKDGTKALLNALPAAKEVSAAPSVTTDPPTSGVSAAVVLPSSPSATAMPAMSSIASSSTHPPMVADFGEEAAEVFRMEAEEYLQTIGMNVAALEKQPGNLDLMQGIRRAMHTLKGAAGMMGFHAIADLTHVSEDLLDTIMEGKIAITSSVLSLILDTAEALDLLVNASNSEAFKGDGRIQALHVRYGEILGENATQMTLQLLEEEVEDVDEHGHSSAQVITDDRKHVAGGEGRRDLSVRVNLQRLDELVNLFGELLVNRSVLEERIQRLVHLVADVSVSSNRLREVGQKLDGRFEAATLPSGRSVQVMPGEGDQSLRHSQQKAGPAHLQEFDELELDRYTEFHQLARGLSEGISDMTTLSNEMEGIVRECEGVFTRENRLSTTFQDRLMKTRLVPISNMAPRLHRAASAVALKQGKNVEFLLEGQATEVDRTVFEEISGPLLHLVRNAVNHAIEKSALRVKKGKPPVGKVVLSAMYEGNQIVITVRDDGTGLDREGIRATAIARGLIHPDQQLSENDIVSLIFHPGFSTAEILSEESGRGVGLDVVRDSVSRLRGTLVVESMSNQGTAFTMSFPTSVAIQRAMMIRIANQQFAIPTVNVESIGRLDNFKRSSLGGQPAVLVRNELYLLQILAKHLGLPMSEALDERAQLIFINAGGRRVALVVEEIKGQFDIVIKNLGPHLRQVHGIAGATVLGNGHVVLILEIADLLVVKQRSGGGIPSAHREALPVTSPPSIFKQRVDVAATSLQQVEPTIARPPMPPATPPAERGKHLLVVDDSPSVRRVVSNMLKQHGWEVQMARDGLEALDMITASTPTAVLLDIEMPRMDGYELISTVRAQEQYRTLPLIVLTSRAASKHQQRASTLGANAYVVKPYQDEELLRIIKSLVYGTARG